MVGEFLVEFDDADEGEAWTNLSHAWKLLSSFGNMDDAEDAAADEVELDTALREDDRPAPPSPDSPPPVAPSPNRSSVEDVHHEVLLPNLFSQLYEETERSDG